MLIIAASKWVASMLDSERVEVILFPPFMVQHPPFVSFITFIPFNSLIHSYPDAQSLIQFAVSQLTTHSNTEAYIAYP